MYYSLHVTLESRKQSKHITQYFLRGAQEHITKVNTYFQQQEQIIIKIS